MYEAETPHIVFRKGVPGDSNPFFVLRNDFFFKNHLQNNKNIIKNKVVF